MSKKESKILSGDCVEVMRGLPDESIDAIVTDPPYGLGFMGAKWDDLPPGLEWAQECLRVLKPGGHLLAFGGSRTYHRLAVAVEDAGFEIRDQIMWLYGSGFPKSLNLTGDYQGWGTALKPAHEPIVVARKPLVGTVAENVLRFGTGALNVDGCRIGIAEGDEPAAGHRTATFGTQETKSGGDGSGGWVAASGRWPANLILDEEAGRLLDEQSGESSTVRNENGSECDEDAATWGGTIQRNRGARGHTDSGGASRFFYCAKAGRAERNAGLDGFEDKTRHRVNACELEHDPKWAPIETKNHHPTVKPISLMAYFIRLVTPPNGIILDPFLGSGTTGCAAALEGFDFIGIECEPDYIAIAEARIKWWEKHKGDAQVGEILSAGKDRDEIENAGQLGMFG